MRRLWPTSTWGWKACGKKGETTTRTPCFKEISIKTSDFDFELPEHLIAQTPPPIRGLSRLLVVDPSNKSFEHKRMEDLANLVEPGTLMVFNDTRVRKARIFGRTSHGGQVEVVLIRPNPEGSWECLVSKSKKLKRGQELLFAQGLTALIETDEGNIRSLRFSETMTDQWLSVHGHLPLPPYIKRPDSDADAERYQTVYARETGSAAAPTAGLHFTETTLATLKARGVELAFVTLEVGLGTFLPVRVEEILEHKMHTEAWILSEDTAAALNRAKSEGRPVLAVGTTSLRTLESAWQPTGFVASRGETNLFITPGYQFKAVDQLFTNFHTPRSTLLMLVCAFAGRDFLLETYRLAVEQQYRFFSYGDATWIRARHRPT